MNRRQLSVTRLAPLAVLVLLTLSISGSASEQDPAGRHSPTLPEEVADTLLAQKLPRVRYLGGPFCTGFRDAVRAPCRLHEWLVQHPRE